MNRQIFGSVDEIRKEWLRNWDANHEVALRRVVGERRAYKLDEFREKFDPTELYPVQWWEEFGFGDSLSDSIFSGRLLQDTMLSWGIREPFIDMLSFSVPARETLEKVAGIIGNGRCIEYMAGSGYWAWLLNKHFGTDVTCVDNHSGHWKVTKGKSFMPIVNGDTRSIKPPEEVTVMMAWIPMDSSAAVPLLKQLHRGQKFIYIGEPGGCTDSDNTQAFLDKYFEHLDTIPMPQFYGIHDVCCYYEKK